MYTYVHKKRIQKKNPKNPASTPQLLFNHNYIYAFDIFMIKVNRLKSPREAANRLNKKLNFNKL